MRSSAYLVITRGKFSGSESKVDSRLNFEYVIPNLISSIL